MCSYRIINYPILFDKSSLICYNIISMLFEANITQSADLISIQSQAETYITKHPAIINTVSLEYLEQLKNIN